MLALTGCRGGADPVRAFGAIPCVERDGVRVCQGGVYSSVASFDGVPLDVNLTLPAVPGEGRDGGYPLVVLLPGYGAYKLGLDQPNFRFAAGPDEPEVQFPTTRELAADGYAVLSYTARGFHTSCGAERALRAHPDRCAPVSRPAARPGPPAQPFYELRDVQHLAGLLADQGLVAPRRIGVVGFSYGAGQALALATLRDRVRLPDGSYRRWRSPRRRLAMEIAAAVAIGGWSDAAQVLAPNGHTVDYLLTDSEDARAPGILKQSYFAARGDADAVADFPAAPGTSGRAGVRMWLERLTRRSPFAGDRLRSSVARRLRDDASAQYLEISRPPAPLLIANGFTDDILPATEAIRYVNRVRARWPRAMIAQLHFDFGHQRASNRPADLAHLGRRTREWLDRHVRGDAAAPTLAGVEVLTQTCPASEPSGGPFRASSWARLHPGEVRFRQPAPQSIFSDAGREAVARAIDPVAAGSNPCATTSVFDQPGTATYGLPRVAGPGYTLAGSPTVIADLEVAGAPPGRTQIAARLWDVGPAGLRQTLVARGLYRPDGDGRRVFQLNPNAYRVEPGHLLKLELLGSDAPYARAPRSDFEVEVSDLDLRLPTLEPPGRGPVDPPAAPFVPPGERLAPGYGRRGG